MNLKEYDYHLPKSLIAQEPVRPRNSSRLMVIKGTKLEHLHFRDIIQFFKKDDVLVLNDTKVLANKLYGKKTSGSPANIIIEHKEGELYKCRIESRNPKLGTVFLFPSGLKGILVKMDNGTYWLSFNKSPISVLKKYGKLPAPNYVKSELKRNDHYQTTYAKKDGSLAAPTSGLHFTRKMLDTLRKIGVKIVYVTLHISFGTFTPIDEEKPISEHKMEKESYEVSKDTADKINDRKGRLVVCGTTAFKTLESAADNTGQIKHGKSVSNLFIYPGHNFNIKPDMMITNFHFPKSTLILFVSAYFGRDIVLNAYQEAVRRKYRFYSLGDATLFIK